MKFCAGLVLLCALCSAQAPPPAGEKIWSTIQRGEKFVPMTGKERVNFLARSAIFSPLVPTRAILTGAFDQWTNEPEAWGQGWDAYGRRVADRWAQNGVRNGIESASAAALGFEQRYIQCHCDGAWRRAGHALSMNFVTYNRRGRWVPNVPRVGSTIASEFIARSWQPPEIRSTGKNLTEVGVQFLTGSLVNVWNEFSPSYLRRVKKKLTGR